MEIVHGKRYRTVIRRHTLEGMDRRALSERIPLPVGEVVGHETGKRRMPHIEPRAECSRSSVRNLEPARAPVDGLELALRRFEA